MFSKLSQQSLQIIMLHMRYVGSSPLEKYIVVVIMEISDVLL